MKETVRSTIQKRDAKGEIRHGGEWLALWSDPKSMQSDAERRDDAAQEQALNEARAAIAASLRSVAQRPALEILFAEETSGSKGICLAPIAPGKGNIAAVRGEADAKASFLLHHNASLHQRLCPDDANTARLFDLMEQARCEGLVARVMPGVASNLTAHHIARLARLDLLNAHLASLIPLSEGLTMVLRDSFAASPVPSIQTAGMRMWDQWLRTRFGPQIARLGATLEDQADYAAAAVAFLEALFKELPSKGRRRKRRAPSSPDQSEPDDSDDRYRKDSDDPSKADLFEPGDEVEAPPELARQTVTSPALDAPYRVFTSRHDRIVKAETLFDRGALEKSRRRLDEKQAEYRQEILRLSGRLQRRLLAQQARRWEFDMDEGMIDASRLDRVVTSPGFTSAYKQETQSPFRNTLVTLLIDNSGSMRGKTVETACVVADILAAALERCGMATEILGFTTRGWKGGQAARDWKQAGRPEDPGRLNELLHIVYKDADTPLRRTRDAICAMLEPSLLKENIDGEALKWAAGRALARPEARKMLIVISDGAPVDQATLEANADKRILDRHLREVIAWIERATPIDLAAIGIKHDVGGHYDNAVRIDDVADLGAAVIALIDFRLNSA